MFFDDFSYAEKLIWLYWVAKAAGGGSTNITVSGVSPLSLLNAVAHSIISLKQMGKCVQASTPTPSTPVDIVCNNGALKVRRQSGLPLAYQMVEWLKPTGAVFITDFKTKSTQEIETVFYRERSVASFLYSSDSATSGTTNTTAYLSDSGNWRWDGKTVSVTAPTGIKITSIQKADGVWLNGTKYGGYSDAGDFVSTNDLRISSSNNTAIRIYSLTVREGEAVTLDLVPVQRLSDSAYGFYDKVSGEFFTNAEATITAGDPIDDPVEIYTDGTPEVLAVSGTNIFNKDDESSWGGYYVAANGKIAVSDSNLTAVIRCLPNTTYYGIHKSGRGGGRMFTVSTEEWAVGDIANEMQGTASIAADTVFSYTTQADAKWLFVCFGRSTSGMPSFEEQAADFMLSLTPISAATEYAGYSGLPQTASVQNLFAVGDYKDEEDIISGAVTRRVGIKVLDGTEANWLANSANGIWMLRLWDKRVGSAMALTSTHFTGTNAGTASMPDNSIKFYNSTAFDYNGTVFIKATAYSTLDDFKSYLAAQYAAGTPVIVLYPLAEPTIESVAAQHLSTESGTNVVSVVSVVGEVDLEVKYKAVA